MFISAYGPGSEKSEEEIEELWNELRECVGSFGRNVSVVVLGDLNARVGNEVSDRGDRMTVANNYWRYAQSRSWWVTVGSRKMMCINTRG